MTSTFSILLRIFGVCALVAAGYLGGVGIASAEQKRWETMHCFARLLAYLLNGIRYRLVPGEDLLCAAKQYPEFALLHLSDCRQIGQIPPPVEFDDTLQKEIQEGLSLLAGLPREEACRELQSLMTLCKNAEDEKRTQVLASKRLYPRLGVCVGLLAAIFFT
jgi:hypothetical protein